MNLPNDDKVENEIPPQAKGNPVYEQTRQDMPLFCCGRNCPRNARIVVMVLAVIGMVCSILVCLSHKYFSFVAIRNDTFYDEDKKQPEPFEYATEANVGLYKYQILDVFEYPWPPRGERELFDSYLEEEARRLAAIETLIRTLQQQPPPGQNPQGQQQPGGIPSNPNYDSNNNAAAGGGNNQTLAAGDTNSTLANGGNQTAGLSNNNATDASSGGGNNATNTPPGGAGATGGGAGGAGGGGAAGGPNYANYPSSGVIGGGDGIGGPLDYNDTSPDGGVVTQAPSKAHTPSPTITNPNDIVAATVDIGAIKKYPDDTKFDSMFGNARRGAMLAPIFAGIGFFFGCIELCCCTYKCSWLPTALFLYAAFMFQLMTIFLFLSENFCKYSQECALGYGGFLSVVAVICYFFCQSLVCCSPRPNPFFNFCKKTPVRRKKKKKKDPNNPNPDDGDENEGLTRDYDDPNGDRFRDEPDDGAYVNPYDDDDALYDDDDGRDTYDYDGTDPYDDSRGRKSRTGTDGEEEEEEDSGGINTVGDDDVYNHSSYRDYDNDTYGDDTYGGGDGDTYTRGDDGYGDGTTSYSHGNDGYGDGNSYYTDDNNANYGDSKYDDSQYDSQYDNAYERDSRYT